MRDAEDFYTAFADALHTGKTDLLEVAAGITLHAHRLRVYRNNVVRGAIDALRAAYPAIHRLIGPKLFDHLAREYRQAHPPERPTLILYGAGFPDHLAGAKPVSGLPWLADVARHDRAWLEAHHAEDAKALHAEDAAALDPETLAALAPGLHPSVRLLVSDWPAHTIWHRNRIVPDDSPVTARPGRHFSMIWRQRGSVQSRALTTQEHIFFHALGDGSSLSAASGAAGQDFDPAAAFTEALGASLLKGLTR